MSESELIGKVIISSTLGVGRVVGIDQIGTDKRYFLVVESVDKRLKNFIPMDDKRSYRTLLSKDEINRVIDELSNKAESITHESKKDRINYFKETSQFQDIETITRLIKELNTITDRGSVEEQIFKRLMTSLAQEHSMIHEIAQSESQELITKNLNS